CTSGAGDGTVMRISCCCDWFLAYRGPAVRTAAIRRSTMSVEKLPSLGIPDLGDMIDAVRPVTGLAYISDKAHRASAHSHPRAHIICPQTGAYWVITPEGTWLVPAGLAIWIPPGIHHEVYSHGAVSAQVLFVDPAHAAPLPARCGTVRV